MDVSLIIPCFNEAKNLPILISRCKDLIEKYPVEIILVDNGSTDNSSMLIAKYPFIKLVKVKKNEGYGNGILEGLHNASGEILAWTHADLQTDPNDLMRGLELALASTKPQRLFLKGRRYGRSLFDVIFTFGMSLFETLLLQKLMWDINAQPTIFHKSFFQTWQKPPNDFSLDLYVYFMAKKSKLVIKRFPVKFSKRLHGTSDWNTSLLGKYKFIKRTLSYSFNLKRKLG